MGSSLEPHFGLRPGACVVVIAQLRFRSHSFLHVGLTTTRFCPRVHLLRWRGYVVYPLQDYAIDSILLMSIFVIVFVLSCGNMRPTQMRQRVKP